MHGPCGRKSGFKSVSFLLRLSTIAMQVEQILYFDNSRIWGEDLVRKVI